MKLPAITVDNIGKRYRIGTAARPSRSRLEAIGQTVLLPLGYLRTRLSKAKEEETLWALRGVSFEVDRGEVIGVIGSNGAGKSTLLKILSHITDPTEGTARICGRVSSLLEVGTGFHPELTGRENVYLNAAIHGLRRAEIDRKFDQIVEFSEISRFIDTPVKRYSSGMYTRLAFGVAAHLEPDVMLVDEVLSVGDLAFQRKCIGKMESVAKEGRTVLFVSHNLPAVMGLCTRCLWFDSGRIRMNGATDEVISAYAEAQGNTGELSLRERSDRMGTGTTRVHSMTITNQNGAATIRSSDQLRIAIAYEGQECLFRPHVLLSIRDPMTQGIYFLDTEEAGGMPDRAPAKGVIECVTGPINVSPGACQVNVALCSGDVTLDHIVDAAPLHVEASDYFGTGKVGSRSKALCLLPQEWRILT